MPIGAWILLVALAVALAYGVWRRRTDGRFRGAATRSTTAPVEPEASVVEPVETTGGVLAGTPFATQLGERATLLQFSSAFCAPCRATRQVLGQVAGATEGVAHVEVDAEQHLDLVRRVGVLRTPTTLVLDERGVEVTRAGGAPRREQVESALSLLRSRDVDEEATS